jgi:hypothetical protein
MPPHAAHLRFAASGDRNAHLIRRAEPLSRPIQSLSWTSRRKRILSRRSCLPARSTPLGYWMAWVFQNHLRENGSTLRSRRGFCFLNKNFQTIGYPSIRCECMASFFPLPSCSVRTVGCGDTLLINRGYYYQTLAERTLDPFIDQARAVPATDKPLVHPYRTRWESHRLHRGAVLLPRRALLSDPQHTSRLPTHDYPQV